MQSGRFDAWTRRQVGLGLGGLLAGLVRGGMAVASTCLPPGALCRRRLGAHPGCCRPYHCAALPHQGRTGVCSGMPPGASCRGQADRVCDVNASCSPVTQRCVCDPGTYDVFDRELERQVCRSCQAAETTCADAVACCGLSCDRRSPGKRACADPDLCQECVPPFGGDNGPVCCGQVEQSCATDCSCCGDLVCRAGVCGKAPT